MTTPANPTARLAGVRYEVELDDGSWWELGWDGPLGTFYAQLWGGDHDEPVAAWHGTRPLQHPDVASLEDALGWLVPGEICAELEADQASWPGARDS